ncbi:hypothetical protein [Schaalia turicensis]|uniref:hypothetical protein n=1 Tax=Schaalia turicensis TaxID=131111 RepID=UPI0034A1D458
MRIIRWTIVNNELRNASVIFHLRDRPVSVERKGVSTAPHAQFSIHEAGHTNESMTPIRARSSLLWAEIAGKKVTET